MTLYELDEKINHESDILDKIRDIVEGTIDHLDRDDALGMLYKIFLMGGVKMNFPNHEIELKEIAYERDTIDWAINEIYMHGFNRSINNIGEVKRKLNEMRRYLNNTLHPLVSPDNYWAYSDLINMLDELEALLFPNKSNDAEKQPNTQSLLSKL